MTDPLVRTLPNTRLVRRGCVSLIWVHALIGGVPGKTTSRPCRTPPARSERNVECSPEPLLHASKDPTSDENGGLNAQVSSAVPFNSLFPHS